jgi:hypothetical protein
LERKCCQRKRDERKGGEGREGKEDIRLSSIPSTSLSETARSTVFTVSLTASVALFRVTKEVEKTLGVVALINCARLAVRRVVLLRKDILMCILED